MTVTPSCGGQSVHLKMLSKQAHHRPVSRSTTHSAGGASRPHSPELPGEPSYPKMPGEPPRVQPSKKVAAHWDEAGNRIAD